MTEKLTWEWGVTFEEGRIAWSDALLARIGSSSTAVDRDDRGPGA